MKLATPSLRLYQAKVALSPQKHTKLPGLHHFRTASLLPELIVLNLYLFCGTAFGLKPSQ
jgi:hypothetical protein